MTKPKSEIHGPQRGLNQTQAANYVGVSPNTFRLLMTKGLMPRPRRLLDKQVWDIEELDAYFRELPEDDRTVHSERVRGKRRTAFDPEG